MLHAKPGLHAEYLPPYAPELNPAGYLWSFLKFHPLTNLAFFHLEDIATATRTHARALQRKEGLLRSFLGHSPLSLRPKSDRNSATGSSSRPRLGDL